MSTLSTMIPWQEAMYRCGTTRIAIATIGSFGMRTGATTETTRMTRQIGTTMTTAEIAIGIAILNRAIRANLTTKDGSTRTSGPRFMMKNEGRSTTILRFRMDITT